MGAQPPLKVLMTADTVGGVWTYALELTRALARHNVVVLLATMGGPLSAAQTLEARRVPNLQIAASDYKLEWMDDPWADVAAAGGWLLRLAADWQPDLVQLNGYVHGALPWPAPTLMVGHSCVLSWWQAVKSEAAPATWTRYQTAVARGLHAADLVVAPTAALLNDLHRHYGAFRRSAVISNGRDPAVTAPQPEEPFILAAGRLWDAAKNLALLDTAAPDLPWPVYVAGSERHPSGGTASHCNVRPLGMLPFEALSDWLGRAAIYALPARYEPFGLSVLEAALAGCALVLGDIASLREIWGDAALYVSPNDPKALQSALTRLIDDAPLRTRLARRARARALHFSAERMAAGYLAAYQGLLRSRHPERAPAETALALA